MKKIKILTIILAVILVAMVAFLGIYTKTQNRMENKIEGYSYAMDIKGARTVTLKVSDGTKTVIKDSEGKEVNDAENLTDEELAEKGYTKEENTYNPEEVLTIENYKKTKEIIEERLKKLNIQNYIVRLNETTGDITIELEENDDTDYIVSNLQTTGKFEIIDTETKEVLMNNDDIKLANVMYSNNSNSSTSTTNSGTSVYLNIEFNKEGSKKLEEITKTYVKVEDKTSDDTSEDADEEDDGIEGKIEEEVDAEPETESEDKDATEKTITMKVDDEDIVTTSFEEPIEIGKLQLTVGQATTDTKTLKDYVQQASNMATALDVENMPVKYEIGENEYVASDITTKELHEIKYAFAVVVLIAAGILCIRFKTKGIISGIAYIGLFAILMLLIRYTNVVLAIDGLFGIALVLILEYIFINKILGKMKTLNVKEAVKESYKEFFIRIIPIAIAVITFCFIKWIPISSFGMVMFWGISLIAIYNFAIFQNLLRIKTENK